MASANGTISMSVALNEVLSSGLRSGVVAHSFDLAALQSVRLSSGVGAGQLDLVAIRVKSTTGAPLAILNGTTDGINLGPGAAFLYFDPVGVTVGAGTTDRFTIVNVSGSVASAHTLIVAGTSA